MVEANARGRHWTLRSAHPNDAERLTDIFLTAFAVSVPGLPLAHSRDEIIAWLGTKQIPQRVVTVADMEGSPAGFVASDEAWVHQLFVAPEFHGTGLGSALLETVLSKASRPIRLWAFQRNAQARRFYERRGFMAELFTDGSTNEERTPDVLYVWRPPTKLSGR
jgi:putative acetyltransferase